MVPTVTVISQPAEQLAEAPARLCFCQLLQRYDQRLVIAGLGLVVLHRVPDPDNPAGTSFAHRMFGLDGRHQLASSPCR